MFRRGWIKRESRSFAYKTWSEVSEGYSRDNPILVRVVEELKEEANGPCANLKIVGIPNNVKWQIEEYDGNECVAELHRTWR